MTVVKRKELQGLKWLFKKKFSTKYNSKMPLLYKERDLYKGFNDTNKEQKHVALYETIVEDVY